MKTNHKLKVKLISLGLLVLMVGVFTQCVATNTSQVGGSSSNNSYTPPPLNNDQDEGQVINQAQVSEGIKSHEQILNTMSELTGVSIMNGSVQTIYNQVATTLPTDNDIKVFLPPHQLAITKLAAEFCKVLVDTTTIPTGKTVSLRAAIWPTFNFNALPIDALNGASRDALIDDVLEAFWGDIVPADEKMLAAQELNRLVEDLKAGETQNTSVITRNVVKGVCTSVLASAHVTLL